MWFYEEEEADPIGCWRRSSKENEVNLLRVSDGGS